MRFSFSLEFSFWVYLLANPITATHHFNTPFFSHLIFHFWIFFASLVNAMIFLVCLMIATMDIFLKKKKLIFFK